MNLQLTTGLKVFLLNSQVIVQRIKGNIVCELPIHNAIMKNVNDAIPAPKARQPQALNWRRLHHM